VQIVSTAFSANTVIPINYTCDGLNVSPPLTFSDTPKDTKSFVLIVEDPDAPKPNFTHWVVYDIPGSVLQFLEGEVPKGSVEGMNDFGELGYGGPCPPWGTHRYVFNLAALDTSFGLPEGISKADIKKKMQSHIIETAQIVGLYMRNTTDK
jgi:Raf kinase inhibitor-like YbhB/YbcL family protein